MSRTREHKEIVAPANVLATTIEDLRRRGFRRVTGEPSRIRQYTTTVVDPQAHLHRLEWLEARDHRSRRRLELALEAAC